MVVCIYYSGWGLFWVFLFCFFNSGPLPSPAGFWGRGGRLQPACLGCIRVFGLSVFNLHSFERSSQPPNLVDTEYRMCIAFVKTQDVLMCFVCIFNADHPFQTCISKHVHSLYHWTVMDRFITLLVFLDSWIKTGFGTVWVFPLVCLILFEQSAVAFVLIMQWCMTTGGVMWSFDFHSTFVQFYTKLEEC